MTTRPAARPFTGRASTCIEVVLGHGVAGDPAVTIHPSGYNRTPFSITDVEVARELADDLAAVIEHLL